MQSAQISTFYICFSDWEHALHMMQHHAIIYKNYCFSLYDSGGGLHLNASGQNTQSVQRALMILNTFTEHCPTQRVSDIARKLHLTPSTVSRHLSTLLDAGLVERDPESSCYRLGIQILTLSGVLLHSNALYRNAYPKLQKLSSRTGLHCFLGIPYHEEVIHLASVGEENTGELFTPVGYRHPLFCSAMGKAIIAYMEERERDAILAKSNLVKYTPYTVTDLVKLKKSFEDIRLRGYAPIIEELTIGKSSLAAPIFDHKRQPIGAISVSGSVDRVNLRENERKLAKIVMDTAGEISGKMGYFPR